MYKKQTSKDAQRLAGVEFINGTGKLVTHDKDLDRHLKNLCNTVVELKRLAVDDTAYGNGFNEYDVSDTLFILLNALTPLIKGIADSHIISSESYHEFKSTLHTVNDTERQLSALNFISRVNPNNLSSLALSSLLIPLMNSCESDTTGNAV